MNALRSISAAAFTIAVALLGAQPAAIGQNSEEIPLPTRADGLAFAPFSQTILYGTTGIETKVPGPVDDQEVITVGLDTSGAPDSVQVDQRLTLMGLGDFEIRVPGPAIDVRALPGSAERPGLRKGAVLWQGFSPGTKVLAATMHLFPELEAPRLPLRFSLSMTVGGAPLQPGVPMSGPLRLSLTIDNATAIPVGVREGAADTEEVARALDAVWAALRGGHSIEPGTSGIPAKLHATGPVSIRSELIESPFRFSGTLTFPPGAVRGLRVRGGAVRRDPMGSHVRLSGLLGGGGPLSKTLLFTGQAQGLTLPDLHVRVEPTLPSASLARPPSPGGWQRSVHADPTSFDGTRLLGRLMDVLWRAALVEQYRQYLGNPVPTGPSSATYLFKLAPLPPNPAAAAAPGARSVSAVGLIGISLAGLALLLGAAVAWSRS
jgi:hypothetical protein